MKQTLNEQLARIKSIMNINEDESQMALMQSTQEFNEKAEEDLTPDEFQEVVCTHPDAIELPSETTNEQKQKFEEFKAKVKTASIAELKAANKSAKEIEFLAPFKVFTGNKPTNSFLIEKITPETLGFLIACYEHKIFTQGVIWNIFSYDQWGVELGKQLANSILDEIVTEKVNQHDSSTTFLLKSYLE